MTLLSSVDCLANGWAAQQLQKEVDAKVAITQKFSEVAPKQIANFANDKMKELEKQGASEEEIAKWEQCSQWATKMWSIRAII